MRNVGNYVLSRTISCVLVLVVLWACGSTPAPSDDDDVMGAGGNGPSVTACDDYISCVSAAASSELADVLEAYGENGSCWQQLSQIECLQACLDGSTMLAQGHPNVPECQGDGPGGRVGVILGLDGDTSRGQTIFNSTCALASCHGPNGNDGAANAGNLPERVPALATEDVIDRVINGFGAMIAQTQLTDQQVADVVAYVKERWPR